MAWLDDIWNLIAGGAAPQQGALGGTAAGADSASAAAPAKKSSGGGFTPTAPLSALHPAQLAPYMSPPQFPTLENLVQSIQQRQQRLKMMGLGS
jgi:hypothetical protein